MMRLFIAIHFTDEIKKQLLSVQNALHRQLTDELQRSGFMLERRSFKPHLTLGREIVLKPGANASEAGSFPGIPEEVHSIRLMKSEKIQGKLTYTAIHEKMF